ncbi:MAG: glycoside hydrolase family 32 protein [Oscillospiraceae bacterium]
MSTQGIRDFRPRIHYSPTTGWINDPNGLVHHQGRYHLFAQHNPAATVHGPMHWDHAVSDDLIHWEHLPIAIFPDKDGQIFSGSAVSDTENLSGLGKDGQAPLIAMYTMHTDNNEEQGIAYSLDGVDFKKYEGNPVLPNPGISDFRDPKIFWNPVKKGWSMVIAAKDRVHFYSTKNFINWEKTGEFGPGGNHASGIWECPDLIALECGGKPVYMLIVSMTTTMEEGRCNTQYFFGDFDGDAFTSTVPFGKMEKIDDGWDNYAGVSFNNLEDKLLMGWGMSWEYAGDTPTGEYCGQMTLPRRLSAVETSAGLRLASQPVAYDKFLGGEKAVKDGDALSAETFLLRIKGNGSAAVTLTNKENQSLVFGVDAENNLFVDRTRAGANTFHASFGTELYSVRKAKRYFDGSYELDFIFDVSILEMFVDGGARNMSVVVYPDSAYNRVNIEGDAEVVLREINA